MLFLFVLWFHDTTKLKNNIPLLEQDAIMATSQIHQLWGLPQLLFIAYFCIIFPCLIQSVRQPLVPYHLLCTICVTYGMTYRSSGHQIPPNPLAREVEDIAKVSKYTKDMSLLT